MSARAQAVSPQPQAAAETATSAESIRVIPQPKRLKRTGASFPLTRSTALVLADARSADDRFAAEDFAADVRETAGVVLTVARGNRSGRRAILLGTLEQKSVREALVRAGVEVPAELPAEGYVLSARAEGVVVAGRDSAGVFYGMQTLKQLVRGEVASLYVQGAEITDWPTMRWRGVSDDISRGPVPTLQYIKRQLRTFASFKLNLHSFYMEHTFAAKSHPLIAPEGGALTPEEIRELVAYARRLHIELVPEQQTFGHLHKALRLEKYNPLAEVPYGDVLSPQQEGTYKLVADWYEELAALFPGRFFHIGADETFELGRGQSSEAVRERGVGAVYFEHLRRVRELLRPHNRRLMFWGDIALNHPELIGSIPSDMIVMNWAYGARDTYAERIKRFRDAGLEQFVCPGVHSWNQIFPNTEAASVNIRNFVRDGQQAGVLGMMNTQWDDDGESLFEMTWYGIVLGAAASWQDAPLNPETFDENFDWAFFRAEGHDFTRATRSLGGINAVMAINTSDDLFWQEPFTDAFQERVREKRERTRQMRLRVEEAEELLLRAGARARRNQGVLQSMRLAAHRFDHMGRRMQVVEQLSRDYWQAYLNLGDRRRVMRLRSYTGAVYNSLREMTEELSLIREEYRRQWLSENRPYWLDSILARYDYAMQTWLAKSRALAEALRTYEETSTLPDPQEFGFGSRPAEEAAPKQ